MSKDKKQEIEFIVLLDACDWDEEVEQEMQDHDVSTHYQNDTVYIEYGDESWTETNKWLVETYGEEIKNYSQFAITAT